MRLTPLEWRTAQAVCTRQQRRALHLWMHGYGYHLIGDAMAIDRSSAREHVKRGKARLAKALDNPERLRPTPMLTIRAVAGTPMGSPTPLHGCALPA